MARKFACGRTVPRRGDDVAPKLRRLVQTVVECDSRIERFHPPARKRDGSRGESAEFHYLARPLPPIRLPDGSNPFTLDLSLTDDIYSGTLPIHDPCDALVNHLWDCCLDAQPVRAVFGVFVESYGSFDWVSLNLQMTKQHGEFSSLLEIMYQPGKGEDVNACRFLAAVGVDHLATPEQLNPTGLGSNRTVLIEGLPAQPSLLAKFQGGLRQLGLLSPEVTTKNRFTVVDELAGHMKLRGRLNALAGGWSSDFPGWYSKGFDPFLCPVESLGGEEYRYPVAAYVDKNRTTGEHPTIQIDVVHAEEGTFLEFQSAGGEWQVRRYAHLAEATIEMWDGPMENRWNINGSASKGRDRS